MKRRYDYVIGDLQGCFAAYLDLLDRIDFNDNLDKIWFAGDIGSGGFIIHPSPCQNAVRKRGCSNSARQS